MKTTTIHTIALALTIGAALTGLSLGWPYLDTTLAGIDETGAPIDQPGVRIIRSDETSIVLELTTPDFQIEPLATEEIACDRLGVADYATNDQSGWPALPVRGAMLGIPPDADVTLTVLSIDTETLPKRYDLCPVPSPIVETEPTGEISYRGEQLVRNEQAYATDRLWPAAAAELVETGFIRSQRVAQIRFHPFQYNPVSGEVRHLGRIQVRLDFNRDGAFAWDAAALGPVNEGLFEETLSNTLLNYESARRWRTRPKSPGHLDTLPGQAETRYRIRVDEDGIYEMTYADLQAAGIATNTLDTLDPHTFQIHNQGQEVAIHVTGEADGSFDTDDYILFYGQKVNTKYTDVNVYWLTWGYASGLRMATADGTPTGTGTIPVHFLTTRHLEENQNYQSSRASGSDNDHWYWTMAIAYDPSLSPIATSYTTTLSHLAQEPTTVTVRGLLRSYSAEPYHHTRIYLNGHLVEDMTWLPQTEQPFSVDVPQSYLLEGTNTISVAVGCSVVITNTDYDATLVNWLEIDYHSAYTATDNLLFFYADQTGTWEYHVTGFATQTLEIFDITQPAQPVRVLSSTVQLSGELVFEQTITGEHHYVAESPAQRRSPMHIERDGTVNLHDTINGADYLIITHGSFYTDVLPLATHRAGQGLRTMVVDVQDVYDEFTYGILDPKAIQDFLAYAYANWTSPPPAYVLLVGDGTSDPRNYLGLEQTYIPPFLANVDPWIGETAADNRYACVSGDDILPDMHIGRLPVRSSAEASAVIDKILNYEQNPPAGDWNTKVTFVADNPDGGGDFDVFSDAIADHYVPAPYTAEKIYYGLTHPTSGGARGAVIDAFNDGRLLVNYIGHSWITNWASEQLLHTSYIAALTNTEHLPLVVPMTCMNGYFIDPKYASLSESLVRATGRGAIAAWAPTGLGIATGHHYLNRGLFEALFFDGVAQLGPATLQGKLHLYSTGGHRELIDTYTLLGDPSLALNVLSTDVGIANSVDAPGLVWPGDTVTYTLTYSNAGPASAHHVVITDTLSTALFSPTINSTGAAITLRPGSRLVWDVADLAPGAGGTITITATVGPGIIGTYTNTVAITATVIESNLDNNTATATITATIHRRYFPIVFRTSLASSEAGPTQRGTIAGGIDCAVRGMPSRRNERDR